MRKFYLVALLTLVMGVVMALPASAAVANQACPNSAWLNNLLKGAAVTQPTVVSIPQNCQTAAGNCTVSQTAPSATNQDCKLQQVDLGQLQSIVAKLAGQFNCTL